MTLSNAIWNLRTLQAAYSASGVHRGEGSTFGDYLATADGQAQLQALEERIDARLREMLRLLPPKLSPGAH